MKIRTLSIMLLVVCSASLTQSFVMYKQRKEINEVQSYAAFLDSTLSSHFNHPPPAHWCDEERKQRDSLQKLWDSRKMFQ